jgi:hypothetical protein
MPEIPTEIQNDEKLGRAVFDADKAKLALKGKIPPRIFQEKLGVRELSVDRLNYVALPVAAETQKNLRGRDCHGWAVLSVSAICQNARQIIPDPIVPMQLYHAYILLPEFPEDQAFNQQKIHALELAMSAQWQAAP